MVQRIRAEGDNVFDVSSLMDIARCVETTGECDPGPRAPSTSTRQIHLQSYSQLTASQQPRDSISGENSAVPCKIPTVVLVNFHIIGAHFITVTRFLPLSPTGSVLPWVFRIAASRCVDSTSGQPKSKDRTPGRGPPQICSPPGYLVRDHGSLPPQPQRKRTPLTLGSTKLLPGVGFSTRRYVDSVHFPIVENFRPFYFIEGSYTQSWPLILFGRGRPRRDRDRKHRPLRPNNTCQRNRPFHTYYLAKPGT